MDLFPQSDLPCNLVFCFLWGAEELREAGKTVSVTSQFGLVKKMQTGGDGSSSQRGRETEQMAEGRRTSPGPTSSETLAG